MAKIIEVDKLTAEQRQEVREIVKGQDDFPFPFDDWEQKHKSGLTMFVIVDPPISPIGLCSCLSKVFRANVHVWIEPRYRSESLLCEGAMNSLATVLRHKGIRELKKVDVVAEEQTEILAQHLCSLFEQTPPTG